MLIVWSVLFRKPFQSLEENAEALEESLTTPVIQSCIHANTSVMLLAYYQTT